MTEQHSKKLKHFNDPNHAHELTFSCYRSQPLLSGDRTRKWLVEGIESARKNRRFSVLAFVIMPEHVHSIIYPQDHVYDVAWYLKSIKQGVSRKAKGWLETNAPEWMEKLTDRKGDFHFWQPGGGYDRNIENPRTLMQMIRYIHNNPVRKGLVEVAGDWMWSSASWYERGEGILRIDPLPE